MEPRNLCVPCTKTTDERCQLLQHREAINEVLLGAGLELCEDVRQVGGARLAVNQHSACNYPLWAEPDDPVRSSAFKLANDLLTCHSRCFTTLEIYSTVCCTRQALDALSKSAALKSLTVCLVDDDSREDHNQLPVFGVVHSLPSLEELVFKTEGDPLYSTVKFGHGHLLGRALRNLTTLDVRALEMSTCNALQLLRALIANHTVADLAVGGCVYKAGFNGTPGEVFARYLNTSAATLKKLTLSDGPICDDLVLWKTLIPALCEMTTLEELNLDLSIGYEIFTEMTALLAEVALRCPTLRLLQLPRPGRTYRGQFLNGCRYSRYNVAQWMKAWLKALRTTSSLRELRLNLPDMDKSQCRTLLQAVANNETLKKVVLQEVPLITNSNVRADLMVLSKTIKKLRLGDRVRLVNLSVTFGNASKILASTKPSTVNFDNLRIEFSAEHDLEPLKACCEVLARRGTLTSFNICCDLMSHIAFGALLDWLAKLSTLTHLEIVADDHAGIMDFCGRCIDMYDQVLSALARNANIARVSFVGVKVQSKHLDKLRDCASTHRNLIGISLAPSCRDVDSCIPHHRNLRNMKFYVHAMMELQELMLKNADRISVAARFVLGEDIRKGARLIERLHEHPRLLELVREGASVTDAEAQEMAQRAMERVRDCSLRDYMRLTGVIKEKVERHDTESKEVHLVNLPADFWLMVRRCLKITHVLIPRGAHVCKGRPLPVPLVESLFSMGLA
ncbi:uncharacterized protein [Dermacentor andersoni]|uniref:uncharacterized protein n=1 Tax=Dermacentor andersoni TaxID=34620 RepID=UPI002415B672|nr:uncharacterized protein LOC129383347 [Dermacentor andersoni]